MSKKPNNLIAIILAIFLLLCSLPGIAEGDDTMLKMDRNFARWGMTLAAMTAGRAVDLLEADADDPSGLLAEFANIDFFAPDKIIFAFLDSDEAAQARKALNVAENTDIAPAFAKYVNEQFSVAYAEAAADVIPDPLKLSEKYAMTTIVVLPYGKHIAVICEGQIALIISTPEVSRALDSDSIQSAADELGVEGVGVRVYESEDISQLDIGASWSGSGYNTQLEKCITASQERFEKLFPHMIGSPYSNPDMVKDVLYSYLRKAESPGELQATCRELIPQMMETYEAENVLELMQSNCDNMRPFDYEAAAPVDFSLDEDGEEVSFAPENTFLFVVRRQYPNFENTEIYDDPITTLDMISEAFLPISAIPDSVESADYIILCDIVWGPEHYTMNDTTLFYPNMRITIHENESGKQVRDLGSHLRKLKGTVVVQNKVNYYSTLRSQVFEMLQPVLEEIQPR